MTASIVQSQGVQCAANTGTTTSFTTTTGNSLVIAILQNTGTTPTPTGTFGDSYAGTQVTGSPIVDTNDGVQWNVFVKENITGGTGTITFSATQGATAWFCVTEVTGCPTSSIQDVNPGTAFVNGTGFTNQVTTVSANDLVLSFVLNGSSTTATMTAGGGTGLTRYLQLTSGSVASAAVGWVLQVVAGTSPPSTPTWTASAGSAGALITLAIKSSGGIPLNLMGQICT